MKRPSKDNEGIKGYTDNDFSNDVKEIVVYCDNCGLGYDENLCKCPSCGEPR